MDLLISRILKYLNGCLDYNHMYRIGNYIVKHYQEVIKYNMDDLIEKGNFTKEEILDFCKHLGFHSYQDFSDKLYLDYQLRCDQIQSRMFNVEDYQYIDYIETNITKDEFKKLIDDITDLMFNKKRIVLIGALYPTSVSVDFQTDLITLGKEVVQYHNFDKTFEFTDNDIVIFISATGRTLKEYVSRLKDHNICEAYFVLITQNMKYANYQNVCADYVAYVCGKYDGIQFNYQIMMILDMLRIHYYKKYYL